MPVRPADLRAARGAKPALDARAARELSEQRSTGNSGTEHLSERRACNLVGVSRRVIRYRSSRPDDGPLRQRLRELAAERRRFGHRRLGYLLAGEGMTLNHKKLRRIYREENLRLRRRGGRKRALGARAPLMLPEGPNQHWSLDFISDTLTCSRSTTAQRDRDYPPDHAGEPDRSHQPSGPGPGGKL